ncbi:uncharacterized protein G2W53_003510 [Senna tora]|uniref:ATP-dependent DNA helicase n=1 Tax=Senna tora TaxID=362788 RepID=A0A834XAX3_9FABA|nr:uncharacterized protein G2W53_003510 [Senna tora]
MQGKVQLPLLKDPPQLLKNLLTNHSAYSSNFLRNIRSYNMMFSFTSMGGKLESPSSIGNGPYVYRLHGQKLHLMGSLLPTSGSTPKFAQLYIYDTDNGISNRINSYGGRGISGQIDPVIVGEITSMLDSCNPLVQVFRSVKERVGTSPSESLKLRLVKDRKTDVGDIDSLQSTRDIVVEMQSDDGYRENIQLSELSLRSSRRRQNLSMREYFSFRLQERLNEAHTILLARNLLHQFIVDAFTMIESQRLSWFRCNQDKLRTDIFKGLADAVIRGDVNPSSQGKRIILPSSFTGGFRYKFQNFHDAMTICQKRGYPNLFITFTCNPKWQEIEQFTNQRGLKPTDRPDILCRVFKIKLDQLVDDLMKDKYFGRVIGLIYTVEFQKRGLPHAHIVVFLHPEDTYNTPNGIDYIISAEIPDSSTYPTLHEDVKNFMLHEPCGVGFDSSPYMRDEKCTKHFPKKFVDKTVIDEEGFPQYKRRDNGVSVEKNGVPLDNRFVVSYNDRLLSKYKAHINVEYCNQHKSIKYLFKYVNKGEDKVTAAFYSNGNQDGQVNDVDEIKMYYDCRYVSACEAAWRIFSFHIQYRTPSVERLSFHLPGEQSIVFRDDEPIDSVVQRNSHRISMFLAWFEANKKYPEAKLLTYSDFPSQFTYKSDSQEWTPRKRGSSIGRLFYVPPGSGELYYMRILLNICKGVTSYQDIRTIDEILYPTFKDACYSLGLLDDDREYIDGIIEASSWGSAIFLRRLFVTLLFSNSLTNPLLVWEKTWQHLSEDILHRQRSILNHEGLQLSDNEIQNYALIEINKLLLPTGRSLKDYPSMPIPDDSVVVHRTNRLLLDELSYDKASLCTEHEQLMTKLTEEQTNIYHTIIDAIDLNLGGVFFLYGFGGSGKTFVWNTLSTGLRCKGNVVLNVASSGIASLLLLGGRTAHSRFCIPIDISEVSICNIKQGSDLLELLSETKLIIWDEAPMANKYCFEALDRTMRDVLRFSNPLSKNLPFGGKVVVFGGDFRQILPVIPKGSRQDIVNAALNSSYLWSHCKVLTLTRNMRLQVESSQEDLDEIRSFSNWILAVGNGTVGGNNDGFVEIEIPDDILIKEALDLISAIVDSTYPSFAENLNSITYLQERAILCPTLEDVDAINDCILSMLPRDEVSYMSFDSICKSDMNVQSLEDIYTPKILNSLRCSGVPNHVLKLKVGTPIMLLRNLDRSMSLCNGSRLIVTQLGKHVIEAKKITGEKIGEKVFIPRTVMTPSNSSLPFKFQRRQFPICLSFAMTINKSQGQSLSTVGLYLPKPVFTNGQFGEDFGIQNWGFRSWSADSTKIRSFNHVKADAAGYSIQDSVIAARVASDWTN